MPDFTQEFLEAMPVVSVHDGPQVSPQEWECGCVTATYVTDRDVLAGEKPFEMRLAHRCNTHPCKVRRHLIDELLLDERNLPSTEWPWATDRLLSAYAARQGLKAEEERDA